MSSFVIVNGALPEFVSVMVWDGLVVPTAWTPKVNEVGENTTLGIVPTPSMVASWEPLPTLSKTVIVPGRSPGAVGVNVTEIVQLAPGPSVAGQSLVWP